MNVETFVADGFSAFQLTVGTSAVPLSSKPLVSKYGARIKALAANGANFIYVGGPDVTASNGYQLAAGVELWLQTDRLEGVYVISNTTAQGVCVLAYR